MRMEGKEEFEAKLSMFGILFLVLEEQAFCLKGSKFLVHREKQLLNRYLKHAKSLSDQIEKPIEGSHGDYIEQSKEIIFDLIEELEQKHINRRKNEQFKK